MKEISIMGIDLAKHTFQIYAEDKNGKPVYNKKISRKGLQALLRSLPPCQIAMEACGSSHYWGRFAQSCGHDVIKDAEQYPEWAALTC